MPEKPTTTIPHLSGETLERALMTTEPSAVDTFGGKVFIRWDPDANVTGFGPAAFHRISEDQRPVGAMGRGLPAVLHQSERPAEAGYVGHGDAFGAGGPQTIRSHNYGPQR